MKQPDKKPVPLRTESPAIFVEAPPSKLLAKLASLRARDTASEEEISRSTSFKDLPAVVPPYNGGLKRDGRLNLVEELEVGPVNHTAPFDDPNFERLEPNSGIKLSCVLLLFCNSALIFLLDRARCLMTTYKTIYVVDTSSLLPVYMERYV